MTFHRFVLRECSPKADNEGIFKKVNSIWQNFEKSGKTKEEQKINEIMRNFNHYLYAPIIKHGIFWFKDGCPYIELARQLCQIMQKYHIKTLHYTSKDPGKILYEDKHQVVALYRRRIKSKIKENF